MSTKEKLIKRLKNKPKDFTFNEAVNLLELLGYKKYTSGKTSGSRMKFVKDNKPYFMHRPHPQKVLKEYQVNDLIKRLTEEGLM
jgi:hypothetical protein